jgi:hypothetical protein
MGDRKELLLELSRDRALAHAVLFAKRHGDETAQCHREMLRDWHGPHPRVLSMGFRGIAKSTLAEEAIVIAGCEREFWNIVIVAENEARGVDRLRAIKYEIENNEFIEAVYDVGPGSTWGETKIILSNGVMIQSYGRAQSLRGIKYLNHRPGLIFCDDLETETTVRDPETRRKTRQWFWSALVNALDKNGKLRMAATPLDPDALAVNISKDDNWLTKTYPIEYRDPETGERVATWPARFPLPWIDAKRNELQRAGEGTQFAQEFMCEAVDPASRTFQSEHFKTRVQVPSWHATYAVYDPARTVKATSATTGKVVFSWIGPRLVVWQADARKWLPNEIIDDIFAVNEQFNPVLIGVEETGLNEWIMTPLRQEQVKRATLVPLRALNAPKGKFDFIRGLQPFFKAGQVEFASDDSGMQLLKAQLLSFPTGDIDAPNALAYALTIQPQQLVYDGFDGAVHVDDRLSVLPASLCWLAVNATSTVTTAILVQVQNGVMRILFDWLREGDPGLTLADIVKEARLEIVAPRLRLPVKGAPMDGGQALKLVAPPEHWGDYDNIGVRSSARRVPVELNRGGRLTEGRDELREAMTHSVHGMPAFQISPRASWTLRALTGGHAYRTRKGELELVDGPYAVLMGGLETFAGLLRNPTDVDNALNYSYTPEGRRYLSALARG